VTAPDNREDIKDLSTDRFVSWLENHGMGAYRANQVLKWVYGRQEDTFGNMTDLALDLRALLSAQFTVGRLELTQVESSEDGSKRFLFGLRDGNRIESVLIPEGNRNTLCISSQVGCALGCRFCLTGKGGLVRNLTPGEIVAQVRDILHIPDGTHHLTNIVLMGMGEPLANYRNVIQALATLTDGDTGLGFSPRRITVSTAGLSSRLPDLSRDTAVNLAVSLNATDDRTRNRLMPINRTYPIGTLLDACRQYRLPPGRRITFEYVLIRGVNDSPENAKRLVNLLRSIYCKVNLIPLNTYSGCDFRRPEPGHIDAFKEILENGKCKVIIRKSRGQDISAACGQLRGGAA